MGNDKVRLLVEVSEDTINECKVLFGQGYANNAEYAISQGIPITDGDVEKAVEILRNYHNGYFGYKIDDVQKAHDLAITALVTSSTRPSGDCISRSVLDEIRQLYKDYQPNLATEVIEFGDALEKLIDNAQTVSIKSCRECPFVADEEKQITNGDAWKSYCEGQEVGFKKAEDVFERMKLIQETVDHIRNTFNLDTESDKLVRNCMALVQNAIDGEYHDMEEVDVSEIERTQGKCEKCDFRKFIDGVVDVMTNNGITSVEQLNKILKGGADNERHNT